MQAHSLRRSDPVDSRRRADVFFAALALAFASVSVLRPFGRDQGVHYFVGRAWLQGAIPYRDTFDHKPPGILFLHAAAISVLGDHMWSIRVLELACVVTLGLVCARLATPASCAVPCGVRGASVLAACVLYFGFFDFWDTAQCEIWCTTAAMGAVCAALRARRAQPGALAAGLLCGAAALFKPSAVPLCALAGGAVLVRAWGASEERWHRSAAAAFRFAVGALLPCALSVAYFAAKGALGEMIDVVVGANGYYVSHWLGVRSAFEVAACTHAMFKRWDPVSSLLLEALVVGLAVGIARRDRALRDRHALALAACALAWLGVLVQLKFYKYHWGLAVGPAVLACANVALDVEALLRAYKPDLRPRGLAAGLFAANLLGAYALTGQAADSWLEEVKAAVRWATGRIDREQFTRQFSVVAPEFRFEYHDAEQAALWLRDHTSSEDQVAVRGFDPEIYAVAHRSFSGRFFWTPFLTDPRAAYRRDEWLAQDRAHFRADPPRWVVTPAWVTRGAVDSADYFEAMGYAVKHATPSFTILERGHGDSLAQREGGSVVR